MRKFFALSIVLCHALLWVGAAAWAREPELPAAAFAALPQFAEPSLSPDGTRYAALEPRGGRGALVVHALDPPDNGRVVFESDQFELDSFFWANDDRLLVAVSYPDQRGRAPTLETRLIAIDADGGNSVALPRLRSHHSGQIGTDVIDLLPADPDHILLSLDTKGRGLYSVYRVNVSDGRAELIEKATSDTANWLVDGKGQVRIRTDYRGQTKKIFVRDANGKPWRQLTAYTVFEGASFRPLAFLHDEPNVLYVMSDRLAGRGAVYRFDVAKGNFGAPVYSHPTFDVADVLTSRDQTRILGYLVITDFPTFFYTDPQALHRKQAIDRLLPDTINLPLSESLDGHRVLILAQGPQAPGTLYLFDQVEGILERLGDRHPQLANTDFSRVVTWSYKARDGLPIAAYVTLPSGADWTDKEVASLGGDRWPLVVMPHGGPISRDFLRFDYMAQFLANRGYAVLQMNFRGSSGYGRAFEMGGFGEWGRAMQDDVTDGVLALIERGLADPARICILGGSYGGYAALMGAVRTPKLYRCAVSINGVTDLDLFVRNMEKYRFAEIRRQPVVGLDAPFDALAGRSPVDEVQAITAPVLLIHGDDDRLVSVEHGERMRRALARAGKPHEFLILPGGDHNLSREAHRIEVLTRVEAFLASHLQ